MLLGGVDSRSFVQILDVVGPLLEESQLTMPGGRPKEAIDLLFRQQRETILSIAIAHGARQVSVFGLRACGLSRPDSDLDLLVSLEPGRSLLDLVAVKQGLEYQLTCRVDVVTEAVLSPYLRVDVLCEAVTL